MSIPLRVLVVEDSEDDTVLMLHELRRGGYDPTSERVDTPEAMNTALDRRTWDIVLCDYAMPRFSMHAALTMVQEKGLDIPFIIVSGAIGEEAAVAAMHAGAHDYVMKGNLARLVPVVERELREAEMRRERKRIEQALVESEEKLRLMFESVTDGIVVTDLDGLITEINERALELCGAASKHETLRKSIFELIDPGDRERATVELLMNLEHESTQRIEYKLLTADVSQHQAEISTSVLRDVSDNAIGLVFIIRDITERKKGEEALRESEDKYRSVVESVSDLIFTADVEGNVLFVNPLAKNFTGYKPEETIGHNFTEYVHPDDVPSLFASIQQALSGESAESIIGVDEDLEFRMVKQDGEVIWVTGRSRPNRDREGKIVSFSGVLRDITERKQMEEERERIEAQLLQAQKMEALGRLAGGVAHDFNNVVTTIYSYSQLLKERVAQGDPMEKYLEQIFSATQRAASLTRQLRAFSRRQEVEPEVLDLGAVVADMDKMLRRVIGEDIELVMVRIPGLAHIKADKGQIEQVIMNLVVNARDAMPQGGRLTIETGNVTLSKKECEHFPEARPGTFVCLSIDDTGTGIDKAIIDRIFEPFYTTKEASQGTGLGLSTVYGIVTQHGGWIDVCSEPGKGATFKVYLPATAAKRGDEMEESISLHELQGSGQRILLVEDETEVREVIAKLLGENGYIVFEAGSSEEALDIFERQMGDFHLVFSDVVLPGKDGLQLVEQLMLCKPELRVVLTSGYSDDRSRWLDVQERGFRFVQKPLTSADLLRATRQAIEPSSNEAMRSL